MIPKTSCDRLGDMVAQLYTQQPTMWRMVKSSTSTYNNNSEARYLPVETWDF